MYSKYLALINPVYEIANKMSVKITLIFELSVKKYICYTTYFLKILKNTNYSELRRYEANCLYPTVIPPSANAVCRFVFRRIREK
jgi:hypothetical protein